MRPPCTCICTCTSLCLCHQSSCALLPQMFLDAVEGELREHFRCLVDSTLEPRLFEAAEAMGTSVFKVRAAVALGGGLAGAPAWQGWGVSEGQEGVRTIEHGSIGPQTPAGGQCGNACPPTAHLAARAGL